MDVRPITARQARTVRLPVLRAGLPPESAILDHDDDLGTLHFGAFDGESLVGVATFFPEDCRGRTESRAWRLRGMATLPQMQRKGAGRALVDAGVAAAKAADSEMLWCHARTSARAFYESMGFEAIGEEFHLPVAGPHYLMIKHLPERT